MADEREFFVSYEGELSSADRDALIRPGWKLYENGIGSTAGYLVGVEELPPVKWRQVVRLRARDGEHAKRLVSEALNREPPGLRIHETRDKP